MPHRCSSGVPMGEAGPEGVAAAVMKGSRNRGPASALLAVWSAAALSQAVTTRFTSGYPSACHPEGTAQPDMLWLGGAGSARGEESTEHRAHVSFRHILAHRHRIRIPPQPFDGCSRVQVRDWGQAKGVRRSGRHAVGDRDPRMCCGRWIGFHCSADPGSLPWPSRVIDPRSASRLHIWPPRCLARCWRECTALRKGLLVTATVPDV